MYRARGTRLDRTGAIKVLPEHVASDADLKQRFEREARTVSSLNHPHICTLYDIGSQDGIDFLVMEYLEGDTLAQRLEKGALPLDQALKIAVEIADALDKAHRQGITHRDLKPGNIMLTKSGAKLLDFGLAKLMPGHDAPVGVSAATVSAGLTGEGTILGTLQYMAPEQLEGREADARSDIFAFGAVVYEMVTGRRAFTGESQASLIAAILEHEPVPMSTLQTMSPPALDYVVKTCLAKDPDDQLEAMPLEGTEGAENPFLSPDERWVGFWADDELRKVQIAGGPAVTICETGQVFGASWEPENRIGQSRKRQQFEAKVGSLRSGFLGHPSKRSWARTRCAVDRETPSRAGGSHSTSGIEGAQSVAHHCCEQEDRCEYRIRYVEPESHDRKRSSIAGAERPDRPHPARDTRSEPHKRNEPRDPWRERDRRQV